MDLPLAFFLSHPCGSGTPIMLITPLFLPLAKSSPLDPEVEPGPTEPSTSPSLPSSSSPLQGGDLQPAASLCRQGGSSLIPHSPLPHQTSHLSFSVCLSTVLTTTPPIPPTSSYVQGPPTLNLHSYPPPPRSLLLYLDCYPKFTMLCPFGLAQASPPKSLI